MKLITKKIAELREILQKDNLDDFLIFLEKNNIDITYKFHPDNDSILHECVRLKNKQTIFNYLIDQKINLNVESYFGDTPLHLASYYGNAKGVEALIKKGVYMNRVNYNDGNTPLHIACFKGNLSAVKVLVNSGARLDLKNYEGNLPIDLAKLRGRGDIIEFLQGELNSVIE